MITDIWARLYDFKNLVKYDDKKKRVYFAYQTFQYFCEKDIEGSILNIEDGNMIRVNGTDFLSYEVIQQYADRFGANKEKYLKIFKDVQDNIIAGRDPNYSPEHLADGLVLNPLTGECSMSVKGQPIKYDYAFGLRVEVPDKTWSTTVRDRKTGMQFDISGKFITDCKWCIPWDFTVFHEGREVFSHEFNLEDKNVLITGSMAIGDGIAWIPHVLTFVKKNKIKRLWIYVTHELKDFFGTIFRDYPITFLTDGEVPPKDVKIYATYFCGLHYNKYWKYLTPVSPRNQRLESIYAWQLGLEPEESGPLSLKIPPQRISDKPYVCIAGLASAHNKIWHNPYGWPLTIAHLKNLGYEVYDIDGDMLLGEATAEKVLAPQPNDRTIGKFPIMQRAQQLAGADFFIGISSGMAWLARAVGCPTVLISGFTKPTHEYRNPYRVFNPYVCNGCLQDGAIEVHRQNPMYCPRYGNDPFRKYECSKEITPAMVEVAINNLMRDYELDPRQTTRQYRCNPITHLPKKEAVEKA